ncbi:MAG: hypothetical protein IT305_05050 [Chloroflexi bacterium]|nr:hypothetical protein [Chloroflexota bacterium]
MARPNDGPSGVSFVIRLWLEGRDDRPEWRLQVRHVQSGAEVHGRCLADLLAFVERRAGVAGPGLLASPEHAEEDPT